MLATEVAPVRVLIVEDEAFVAVDLEDRLRRLGYDVNGVFDKGDDALAFLSTVKVDLVLMDIHIRGSRDGIETAAALRATHDVPVVFLTAHSDDETLQRAGLTEPFGYVLKPFEERELHVAMRTALYRHQAETRLRKMERWLATTLRSIGDGVIAVDSVGRITFVNAMAEALTGWPRGMAIGRHLSEVFAVAEKGRPDETVELLRRAMTEGATVTLGEGRYLRTRSGDLLPVDDSLAPIRDDEGVITGCVVIFRDHTAVLEAETARRKMEEKMQEAQRLESLGVLASGIAHDFNNLLVAVTCNSSLVRGMLPPDSPALECLQDIENAGERAALLCNQMLAYAGRGSMRLEIIELSGFARETAQLLQVAIHKNTHLVMELADALPPIRADRSQLQQIVMNLVINGSEAMNGEPGALTLKTSRLTASRPFLSTCRVGAEIAEGDYVMLEVIDSGSGMSAETLSRIFDPFFTTKLGGRGLGLAALSGIVREHRGALAVESQPGQGTTFRVLFPAVPEAAPDDAGPSAQAAWRGKGRILVADDEPSVRLVCKVALRQLGFDADTAEDGRTAVEKATAAGADYRVVLMDLTMPNLTGHSAYLKIRAQHPNLPILMMSGFAEVQIQSLFETSGPVAFLQKPFTLERLAERLSTLVGAK